MIQRNEIKGVSYIGNPRSNTAVFIVKKVEHLLQGLYLVSNCLVFIENGISIPKELYNKHSFRFSDNPKEEYALFAEGLFHDELWEEREQKYVRTDDGYYLGKEVAIGESSYVAPGVLIGHGVQIGKNVEIWPNAVIKHAVIGDNVIIREGAVVGAEGYTLAKSNKNNLWIRIPSLGGISIGNNVEIGTNCSLARGTAELTIIEDNVKMDALVYIGHDTIIRKNVEISAGCQIGGYAELKQDVVVGLNSTIRNRVIIGEDSMIGMGAVVTKSIGEEETVIGNPARKR